MHFSPHPVPNKFAHDGETKAARFILDFSANVADAPAFAGDGDCTGERIFGNAQQLIRAFIDDSNWNSRGVIAYPAILNYADVQFHNVAILNSPLAADAVNHFVVKRDADVTGKNAVRESITEKCTYHMGFAHEVRCRSVDFVVRNAGSNQIAK